LWLGACLVLATGCKVNRPVSSTPAQDMAVAPTYQDSVQINMFALPTVPKPAPVVAVQDSAGAVADSITIIGVGDIMLGTNYPKPSYLPPGMGQDLWPDLVPVLRNADITFGNLEGVILNDGGTPKYCSNPAVCYLFRSPEVYAWHLVDAGFDVMSTANNHAGDFGNEGRQNTMKVLNRAGIAHAGLLSHPDTVFERSGLRIGFAAFAPNTGTVSINDVPAAMARVQRLDSLADIVIVSFHGGAEGAKHTRVTRKTETFYGENRGNVYDFAHRVIDAGADVVFGHGPHVTRAIEVYKDRFISYSLGNFCTYGRFNLRGDNGIAPLIKLWTGPDGQFFKGHITPIYQPGEGGAQIDAAKRVIRRLQTLTKADFPEGTLTIKDDGWIFHTPNKP